MKRVGAGKTIIEFTCAVVMQDSEHGRRRPSRSS